MYDAYVDQLIRELERFCPQVYRAESGSVYIRFSGSRVREIRIADHKGHRLSRNVWELRSDAMTSRKNPANRVYNHRDVKALIKDFR
jgi:hypothetical protein